MKSLLLILAFSAILTISNCENFRGLHEEQELTSNQSHFDLESLIAFRQDIHQNPEPGFQEFRTQKKLIQYLKSLGIKGSSIKKIAVTGLQVDIAGKAKASGADRVIAFRADIDALDIVEDNPTLSYRSVNGNAHSCGHDGHMTSTLGFAAKLQDVIHKIPKNKVVRLLFQPSEEGPEIGAPKMIEDGCLEDVQEIYGWHNAAQAPVGYFATMNGMMLGQTTYLNLKIHGVSGHAATTTFVDPVLLSISFFNQLKDFNAQYVGHDFILNFPYFKAAERWNVGADLAELRGAFRTTEIGFDQVVKTAFIQFLEGFKTQNGVSYELEWRLVYHPVINNTERTADVIRVATRVFGASKVVPTTVIKNSEDFSYYQQLVPGNYFYLGSAVYHNDRFVHNKKYNFNDNLIPVAANFLYELAIDRLGVTV